MNYSKFTRLMIMNFIISVVITIMVSFVLSTVKIDNMAYLGILLGLYIFAVFGINRMADEKAIESKSEKFTLAVLCIIIFYLFFTFVMPHVFDMSYFGIVKIGKDLILDSQLIFLIFSVVVLILSCR